MNKSAKELQQKIATSLTNAVDMQLSAACSAFPDHGAKVTVCSSVALVGILGAAQGLSKYEDIESFRPTGDHVLFTCLLVSNSVSHGFKTPQGDAFTVEWSIDLVIKTMDQFQTITGRSFEPMMNESLLELIDVERKKSASAFTGDMSKFQPN